MSLLRSQGHTYLQLFIANVSFGFLLRAFCLLYSSKDLTLHEAVAKWEILDSSGPCFHELQA